MKPAYIYKGLVTKVVDGDTIDCDVDLGFTVWVAVRFRLNGIDTMETNDKDPAVRAIGKKAKELVTWKLLNKDVTIVSHGTDKYGRWLGDIYLGDECINETLLTEGLAVGYWGGKKVDKIT